jgi:hypothetical protein
MIEKLSGRVSYAVGSFGGFLGLGAEEYTVPCPLSLVMRHTIGPTAIVNAS